MSWKSKEKRNKYDKEFRERCIREGLCTCCGKKPAVKDVRFCQDCRERVNNRLKQRYREGLRSSGRSDSSTKKASFEYRKTTIPMWYAVYLWKVRTRREIKLEKESTYRNKLRERDRVRARKKRDRDNNKLHYYLKDLTGLEGHGESYSEILVGP